jgi:hypothetical protein
MILGEGGAAVEASLMDRLDEVLSLAGPDLLSRVGEGHMSPAAYDTGWVARIADPSGSPEFPEALDWLVANQRDDGSWGSEVFHEYDRFINTLSAAIALRQWGHAPEVLERAQAYLVSAIDRLNGAEQGVSSDHLVAALMEEARRIGLELPYGRSPHQQLGPVRRALLSYVYVDPEHPLGHFVEILGRTPNMRRVTQRLQLADGSIMSSGASTASSIVLDSGPVRDHTYYSKLRYLKQSLVDGGGVRHFWDLDVMDRVYSLYHLRHTHGGSDAFKAQVLALESSWTPGGLSFGRHFRVSDLDDTAMGYLLLQGVGREPDWHALDAYWHDDHFVTYAVESKGRSGPNVHALEAVALSSHPQRDAIVDATVRWLRGRMVDGRYLVDDWHLSPAYCSSHAILAFHLVGETQLRDRLASFFMDTQHEDGSWGYVHDKGPGTAGPSGTVEETAFALQGLLYYHRFAQPIYERPLREGVEWLLDHYPCHRHPEMWMAKVLYAPGNIIESVVVGALTMYRDFVGGDGRARSEATPSRASYVKGRL